MISGWRCDLSLEHPFCADAPSSERYHWDGESKTCKQFTYIGCPGDENYFKSMAECQQSCA